ncbi:hypothetical protein [Actinomadura rugatobispora]|uniref:JAB domain-containing protein n=1 Tax=Actinomadura rugatobispora TaxID=1994 RepID=A0ABW0ZZD2_9ACTN|nr:hypothetical protein GCM10010200_110860 [Actinomadura rugatobispora]
MNDHYLVRIFESELRVIADETFDHERIETGGSLFGLFSHGGGPTVFLATRPSERAVRGSSTLELDPDVTWELERLSWEEFGVQCLGMWHSHHWFDLHEPSSGDRERTRRYAQKHQRPQYTEILANFVGPEKRSRVFRGDGEETKVKLTPFFYMDARNLTRAEASLKVLPGESPLRRALSRVELDGSVAGSLRPAALRPRVRYVLASSDASAAGSSWWRGLADRLPHFGDSDKRAALETRADPGAADDTATDAPERDEPERSEAAGREPERTEVATRKPSGEQAPADAAPARPAKEEKAEKAGERGADATPADPRRDERGGPRLSPVPDLADYVRDHIQPLLQVLEGRYEAELQPIKHHRIALIVRVHGRRSRLHFYTAWDGERPLVLACRLFYSEHEFEEWRPSDEEERYGLPNTLAWGLRLLDRAP